MNIFLETKRLLISPPTSTDLENLSALQADPEVMRFVGQGVRSISEVQKGLEKAIAHQQKHGFSLGSVYEKGGTQPRFIGRAGLIHLAYDDTQPDIEVGYALTPSVWQKGYATELTRALIDWAFKHLSINKVVGIIQPNNTRSRRILEKVGMRYLKRSRYYEIEVAHYEVYKNDIQIDQIKLVPATLNNYPVIQNMAQYYVYDMSEFMGFEKGWEISSDGLYVCIDFKKYWEDNTSYPFLIYCKEELAGFAIVDKKGSCEEIDFNMAQFFILRKFKNKGVGRYAAQQCFDKFRGCWEVMVMPGNEGAYRFWRSVIGNYTKEVKEYTRSIAHFNHSIKNIFKFHSR